MKQRTIKNPVELVGIGLHKGVPVRLRLESAEENTGIIFTRIDKGVSIPLCPESVVDTNLATTIGKGDIRISTIEHFLSAIYAMGIDNLHVFVDNEELPIMDGSAISFCMLLGEAGIIEQNTPKKIMKINKPIEIRENDKYVKLIPSKQSVFEYSIDFKHPLISKQRYKFIFSTRNYKEEIAKARTFGFLEEVQYLRSKGLALGGSLQNAIVLDKTKILNKDGLRYKDEFVRHKILDAMGDLCLLGMPVYGAYQSYAGSHKLNHLLTKALLSDSLAYSIIEFKELKSLDTIFAIG